MSATTTDGAIAWLDEVSLAEVDRVGGKGANLGEMASAGFPVPPGFVVCADGYLAAMDAARRGEDTGAAGSRHDLSAA